MDEGFEQLQKTLSTNLPNKGFVVASAHYREEKHSSTELLSHYAALRAIFAGWQTPRSKDGLSDRRLIGRGAALPRPVRALRIQSFRRKEINSLGYALLGDKKIDEAMAAFKRNVELYPRSANVYDSLADGLEAQNKADLAMAECPDGSRGGYSDRRPAAAGVQEAPRSPHGCCQVRFRQSRAEAITRQLHS